MGAHVVGNTAVRFVLLGFASGANIVFRGNKKMLLPCMLSYRSKQAYVSKLTNSTPIMTCRLDFNLYSADRFLYILNYTRVQAHPKQSVQPNHWNNLICFNGDG